jgi:hypothetical protein
LGGLTYLELGIGFVLSSIVGATFSDKIYAYFVEGTMVQETGNANSCFNFRLSVGAHWTRVSISNTVMLYIYWLAHSFYSWPAQAGQH